MYDVYFIMRHGIFMPGSAWRLSRLEENEYRKRLFAEERVRHRLEVLKAVPLSSLASMDAQGKGSMKLLILTSPELVTTLKAELPAKLGNGVVVEIIEASEGDDYKEALNDYFEHLKSPYWTIRLDDDDGLCKSYLHNLKKYEFLPDQSIVSFPLGVLVDFDDLLRVNWVRWTYTPKTALGIAMFHCREKPYASLPHIYNAGSHTALDSRFPVLLDSSFIAYIRGSHSHNDSSLSKSKGWFDYVPDAPTDLLSEFGFTFNPSPNFSSIDVCSFGASVIKKASRDAAYRSLLRGLKR